jgi:hypothetical protein
MKVFISQELVERYGDYPTFITPLPLCPGELALFNKNGLCWDYFQNAVKAQNRYGWIAECDSIPAHWLQVIRPEYYVEGGPDDEKVRS